VIHEGIILVLTRTISDCDYAIGGLEKDIVLISIGDNPDGTRNKFAAITGR